MNRINELENQNEELRNKLDIAVQRREYLEKRLFDSQYITGLVEENALQDIQNNIDREFMDAIRKIAMNKPGKVRGL